jgi:hypothetical protein
LVQAYWYVGTASVSLSDRTGAGLALTPGDCQ